VRSRISRKTAERCPYAKDCKELAGDVRPAQRLEARVGVESDEVSLAQGERLERTTSLAPLIEVGGRETEGHDLACCPYPNLDQDELLSVSIRKLSDQDAVHDAEDRGAGTGAKGQGESRSGREARAAEESAARVTDLEEEPIRPSWCPHVIPPSS